MPPTRARGGIGFGGGSDNAAVTRPISDGPAIALPDVVVDGRGPAAPGTGHGGGRRDTLLLGAAVVLPRATGFLTLPVYTRVLGPEDFGRYELLIAVMALLYAVCLVGLDFAIAVRYFSHDEEAQRRDVASAVAVAGVASVATAAVLGVLGGTLGPWILQVPDGAVPFTIAVAAVPFNVVGGILGMYLRLRFRGLQFFRAMLGGAIAGTAIGLVLVVVGGWGLTGAITGLAIVHVATFGLLALTASGLLARARLDRAIAYRLARLGVPLVPAGAASWIFALADRFFLAAFLGFVELGLYASAARLATILALVQFGFHAAWGPLALGWGSLFDRDRRYAASLRLVAVAGGAAIAIIAWLAEPLLWLLAGPAYVAASGVVWTLAAAVLFSAMFFVVQIGANLAQRGGRVAIAMIVAAIVNTAANIVLIPAIGYPGAGLATLVTYALAYVVMYALSQQVTPLRLSVGRSTGWAIAWTATAAASGVVPDAYRVPATAAVVAAATALGLWAVLGALTLLDPAPRNAVVGASPREDVHQASEP
jgi:O-antigen/teichoic acid export membrane protein